MPQWSDFFPDAPYAGAFGTGTPQEEATRAPTPVDNAVRGTADLVAAPGKLMSSNPYKPGTEEWHAYEAYRQQGMDQFGRDAALSTMGAGATFGVPAAAGETVLAAGAARRRPPVVPETGPIKAIRDSGVSRSTDLPDLRGMPVEDATRMAVTQPHLIKAGDQSAGYYVGGPRDITGPKALTDKRNEFYDYVAQDPRGGDWYDRYRAGLNELNGGDPVRNRWMSNQEGQWSAGVSPEGELGFALKENNASIAGQPVKAARPAQHNAHEAAIEAQDPSKYQLGKKTGEYARRIEPLPEPPSGWNGGPTLDDGSAPYGYRIPTATGVNDFRHARNFGYTEANGQAQKNAVTGAGHRFLDYETALAVERANREKLGGRGDWTGEQIQAAPWVRQKAEDLMSRNKALTYDDGFKRANTTIADFFDKHTAFGTHEAQPGAGIGHLPGLETASPAEKAAYAADPRSRWDFAPGGRDAIYSGTGIPGTGNYMRVRPSLEMQGAFEGPNGMEFNGGMTARPLVAFDAGKGAAKGTKSVAGADQKLLNAGEGLRAFLDAQHAGAWHKPWLGGAPGKSNSLFTPMGAKATEDQMRAMRSRGAEVGLPDAIDTGQGVTLTNFGGEMPKDIGKTLRKTSLPKDIEAVTGSSPQRAKVDSGYLPMDFSTPGSGAATREMLSHVTQTPEIRRAMNANPDIARASADRLMRDEELAAKYGAARPDIQNARRIIANSKGDWIGDLEAALKKGAISLPAVAALVGPAYQQLSGRDR